MNTESVSVKSGASERLDALPPRDGDAYRMVEMVNYAQGAISISVGVRIGLFEVIAGMSPSTSQEIADAAGLNERYVREWLIAMASVDIVKYSPDGPRYHLPESLVPVFTHAGGGQNVGRFFPMVGVFAAMEDRIIECFRTGDGIAPTEYERLEEHMAAETGTAFREALLNQILPEFGLTAKLDAGSSVADLGCGYGYALHLLAAEYPDSDFSGFDVSPTAVQRARELAAQQGLDNVIFEVMDIEPPSLPATYDLLMACNVVHDLAHPGQFLRDAQKYLKTDGAFILHEIDASSVPEDNWEIPHTFGILNFSIFHCLPLSLYKGGEAVGGLWGRQAAAQALRTAGFKTVQAFKAPADPLNVAFFAKVASS